MVIRVGRVQGWFYGYKGGEECRVGSMVIRVGRSAGMVLWL
jgi:hypothetical protein